jgi:hypothetical protein
MAKWRNSGTHQGNTTKLSCCKEKEEVQLGVGEMRNYKTFLIRNLIGKYNLTVVDMWDEYYSIS